MMEHSDNVAPERPWGWDEDAEADTKWVAVRAYMDEIASLVWTTEMLRRRVDMAHVAAEPGAIRYRDTPGSPNAGRGPVESGALEVIWAENALAAWEETTASDIQRARDICERWPASVVWSRWVDGMTAMELAERTGKSRSYIYRATWLGIFEIYDTMPDRWRRLA